MKLWLASTALVSGMWGCLAERPARTLSTFSSNSGSSLCSITNGGTSIELRGDGNVPAGFVIDAVAVEIEEKGSGEWKNNTQVLGKYKIYTAQDNDNHSITLKWTEGGSMSVLKRIEHLNIERKSDKNKQNLYTYYSSHNGEHGTAPTCI